METQDLSDIGDSEISDMRPDHVGHKNDHATFRRKRASSIVNPRERRRIGNENPNTENYLEHIYSGEGKKWINSKK